MEGVREWLQDVTIGFNGSCQYIFDPCGAATGCQSLSLWGMQMSLDEGVEAFFERLDGSFVLDLQSQLYAVHLYQVQARSLAKG